MKKKGLVKVSHIGLHLEVRHVSGNTYYIPSAVNIGLYIEDGEAILINSGSGKEAGREILRLLNEFEWQLKLIVNTHGQGDHMGGNAFLQEKTGCAIAATQDEASLIENPLLEAALIYGGYPNKDLRQKMEVPKASKVTDYLGEEGYISDTELSFRFLPGRSLDTIGVLTPDKIAFIGESLMSEEVLKEQPFMYLWDIRLQLQTLEELKKLEVEGCVISHGEFVSNPEQLIDRNIRQIEENLAYLKNQCQEPSSLENLVQTYCVDQGIALDVERYVRLSAAMRNYLAHLQEEGLVQISFENERMTWRTV